MKFFPFLLCFFAIGSLKAQDAPNQQVPNEYIIYFADGTTPTEVNNTASTWCSTLLNNFQTGDNIGVFKFNCTFPFTNPFDPSDSILDLIEVVTKVKKHDPEADGGSLNYHVGGNQPGINIGNCYNQSFIKHEIGDESVVSAAVFDTGTNWDQANMIGYNFGTPHEMNGDATDKHGHGTHVAGIVNKTYLDLPGGTTTNAVHYAFGNPLAITGTGTLAEMVLSMEDAIDHGSNSINCSFTYMRQKLTFGQVGLGGPGTSGPNHAEEDVLYLLMKSANPTSTLFIVSAGNHDGFDLDGTSNLNAYPAAFPLDNIITVASHGCLENLSPFSNLGAQSVDIAAPGENIISIDDEMNEAIFSGTSQAAAHVTGAVIVVGSHLPYFDAAKVKCAIMTKAAYRPSFNGLTVSEGILDIGGAVDFVLEGGCETNNNLYEKRIAQNNKANSEVSIKPTIIESNVDIAFELLEDSPVIINIYSLSGQNLLSTSQSGISGTNKISVNLDHLPTSSYMLIRIETNEFAKTSKIIKVQ